MCIKIGGDGEPPQVGVKLHGTTVEWKKKVKFLGNFISHYLSDSEDVAVETVPGQFA